MLLSHFLRSVCCLSFTTILLSLLSSLTQHSLPPQLVGASLAQEGVLSFLSSLTQLCWRHSFARDEEEEKGILIMLIDQEELILFSSTEELLGKGLRA